MFQAKEHSRKNQLPTNILLLVDNCTAHSSSDCLQSDDGTVKVIFLPPNVTSLVQPMDKNVILPVKTTYRKKLLKKILSRRNPDVVLELKNLNLSNAIDMLKDSWDEIAPETIFKSWDALLSNYHPYRDYKEFLNLLPNLDKRSLETSDIEEIMSLALKLKKLSSDAVFETSEQNIIDWMNSDECIASVIQMTDEELIRFVNGEESIMDDISSELDQEEEFNESAESAESNESLQQNFDTESEEARLDSALSAVNNLIDFYQNNEDIQKSLMLRSLKNELIEKIVATI